METLIDPIIDPSVYGGRCTLPPGTPGDLDPWDQSHVVRGKFIVFDGIDGSGKGTLVKATSDFLTKIGVRHCLTKQPGGSTFGDEIRRILFETIGTKNMCPDALELLFMANHAENCAQVENWLSQGMWVIADRWSPSALAYMAERKANRLIQALYRNMLKRVKWDRFFLLTGRPEVLLLRAQRRTTETHQAAKKWNNVEAMTKIDQEFKRLFADEETTDVINTTRSTTEDEMNNYVIPVITKFITGGMEL